MMWNNGQAITPEITLKLGNYTLVKGTDYTVTYNNNQNETTKAEINVTGTGNFTGTKTYYLRSQETEQILMTVPLRLMHQIWNMMVERK